MRNWRRVFAFGLLGAAVGAAAAALLVGLGDWDDVLRRRLLFGSSPLEIRSPHPGQLVAQGGVEVIVAFPAAGRAAVDSFRCLLNGNDVTASLTRGENGAAGSVVGAVEGPNRLRVEVFGEAWWGRTFFEDAREVVFWVRPLPALDRAAGAPPARAA